MFSSIENGKIRKKRSESISVQFYNVSHIYYQPDYWVILCLKHGFEVFTNDNISIAAIKEKDISHLTFAEHMIICHTENKTKVYAVDIEANTVNFEGKSQYFKQHIWSPRFDTHILKKEDIKAYLPVMNYTSFAFIHTEKDKYTYYDTWSMEMKPIPKWSTEYYPYDYDPDRNLMVTRNLKNDVHLWDTRYTRNPLYAAPGPYAYLFHGFVLFSKPYVSYFDVTQHTLHEDYLSYHLKLEFNPFEPSFSIYTVYGTELVKDVFALSSVQ